MAWFVATNAMLTLIDSVDVKQTQFPIELQIYLIEASTEKIAIEKATAIGKDDEEAGGSGLTLDDRPAKQKFLGIKRLSKIFPPPESGLDLDNSIPESGAEVLHIRVEVKSLEKAQNFMLNDEIITRYD